MAEIEQTKKPSRTEIEAMAKEIVAEHKDLLDSLATK